jgi:hypothetical protein
MRSQLLAVQLVVQVTNLLKRSQLLAAVHVGQATNLLKRSQLLAVVHVVQVRSNQSLWNILHSSGILRMSATNVASIVTSFLKDIPS